MAEKKLVRWWVMLNSWEWPKELAALESPDEEENRERIRVAHTVVDALVPKKEWLSAWRRHIAR